MKNCTNHFVSQLYRDNCKTLRLPFMKAFPPAWNEASPIFPLAQFFLPEFVATHDLNRIPKSPKRNNSAPRSPHSYTKMNNKQPLANKQVRV